MGWWLKPCGNAVKLRKSTAAVTPPGPSQKGQSMKVAIMFDERDGWYRAYKYSWFFRVFGASICRPLALGFTAEDAVKSAERKINGKITLIRIAEI